MKKTIFIIMLSCVLAGCYTSVEQPTSDNTTPLTLPKKTEIGFVQLSKNIPYYVDSSSVWVDEKQRHLVHFDTVLNLQQGEAVFDKPKWLSHSVREHKTLDCKQQKLTHRDGHLYSEFWGKGQAIEAQNKNYSLNLKSGSTLGIIGQILCANFYRK